jgi:hypothetical protein
MDGWKQTTLTDIVPPAIIELRAYVGAESELVAVTLEVRGPDGSLIDLRTHPFPANATEALRDGASWFLEAVHSAAEPF